MSEFAASIALRAAVPADAARLTEIAFAAKRHWGYPESWVERWREALTISPEACVESGRIGTVAVIEGSIVGFCALAFGEDEASVEHLWVLPEWMGRGVGRRLFEEAERAARARGVRVLTIESDPNAEGFYVRMGARTVGRIPANLDGVERSLAAMRKELAGSAGLRPA